MVKTIVAVFLLSVFSSTLSAATVQEEIDRVAAEAAALELGFGGYHLGAVLTADQKNRAGNIPVAKAMEGTYKFLDTEVFVVAAEKTDMVLGVYKQYPDISTAQLKKIVGDLIFEHGEPTLVAHDKLIYWSYDRRGKISQDVFDFQRQSGGTDPLVTVKFSNSEVISAGDADPAGDETMSAYVMITSDPLSKLFLASLGKSVMAGEQ